MEKVQYVELHDRIKIFIVREREPERERERSTQAAVWGKDKRRKLVCSGDVNPSLCYEMKAISMSNTSPGKDTPVSILVMQLSFKLPLNLCKSQLIVLQQ